MAFVWAPRCFHQRRFWITVGSPSYPVRAKIFIATDGVRTQVRVNLKGAATGGTMAAPLTEPGAHAEGMREWMERYGPALRRHFYKRGAAADAEDLTQEVFLRLQVASSRTAIDNVERYIFRIANNVLVSHHRHDLVEGRPFHDALPDEIESSEPSAERILLGRERWIRFQAGLEALPKRALHAFLLHRFENMTYPMIARRMGISTSAVEKLISRALVQLTIELDDSQ